jgi:hypothetical protein
VVLEWPFLPDETSVNVAFEQRGKSWTMSMKSFAGWAGSEVVDDNVHIAGPCAADMLVNGSDQPV